MPELRWQDFSPADKEKYRRLRATFVMAPRKLSQLRLVDLVKQCLDKNNVIFGIAEEDFVDGFADQPQFRTLPLAAIAPLAKKIEAAGLPHSLLVLTYPQAAVDEVIRAIRPNDVVLVRGSWHLAFQHRSTYALLEKRGIPFRYVSPFLHEQEAKNYLSSTPVTQGQSLRNRGSNRGDKISAAELMEAVREVATQSFDYSFQTGAVLAEAGADGYELLDAACNEVVPYQTYALHFGNSREENLARVNDANYYDTIHAEMNLLVRAMLAGVSFAGKSLFINLLPCPSCARTLVKTGLKEVVYQEVHSGGYALKLFENAGIKTRKVEL